MTSVNDKAFSAWYVFALVAGGSGLPLMLTLIFLFGSTLEQASVYSYIPAIALAIVLPMMRFAMKGQESLEGWKTAFVAALCFHLGILVIGWPLLHFVVVAYWGNTPREYHQWIGPILLVPTFFLLVYLDLRLQKLIAKMDYGGQKS